VEERNGSGGSGGRGRALLVADQGASRLPHARYAAARLCRRATAARRGRPRARARRGRWRGDGGERGWAGPSSASGPEVRPRPASAPLFPFLFFFLIFFSQTLSKFIWTILKSFSPLSRKMKVVPKQKPYNFILISKTKFQIEFELQIKTISRFSNKFILEIFV